MSQPVHAALRSGMLAGVREASGVCRYSAIAYAQAPVGPLRFAPPQPVEPHAAIHATSHAKAGAAPGTPRNGTRPGPVAPQIPSRLRDAMGDFDVPQSEDCLHLTVWTPDADARRRPVVVWLHGGAWQSGGGALDWYDGTRLAARGDIVVVAVNYRLAALGWLYVPGETANVGLLDQEAAVDWVVDNIADLGGDPERVTVMGQSAGASSICAMLTRRPRFSRAILQSAALGRGFRSAAQAQALASAFLNAAGADCLDAARKLPVSTLLSAQQDPAVAEVLHAEGSSRSQFCPVLDGDILPQDIAPALHVAASRADVLVAYTRDEMAAFPGLGVDAASREVGEQVFGEPSRRWASDAVAQGRQAWLARFDIAPTQRFGACHCIELPFVFDTLDAFRDAPMLAGLPAGQAAQLTQQTQAAWIAFIRGETPAWPMAPQLQILG